MKYSMLMLISLMAVILAFIIALLPWEKPEIINVGEIPDKYNNIRKEIPKIEIKNSMKRKNAMNSVVSEKTIYLTFDDGPSYLTNEILNILRDKNVPATFFVVSKSLENYSEVIKRAYDDGHTIALHSDTHNYKYIYSADENYFSDLKNLSRKVYNIIGTHSRIVRLPGGSSNTISKNYNQGIVTRITNKLKDNDYYYFDWNVDSKDASGKITKEEVYSNTVNHLKNGPNIILFHDASTKKTTMEALSDIITYAQNNGYTFSRITKNTPQIRHKINN